MNYLRELSADSKDGRAATNHASSGGYGEFNWAAPNSNDVLFGKLRLPTRACARRRTALARDAGTLEALKISIPSLG